MPFVTSMSLECMEICRLAGRTDLERQDCGRAEWLRYRRGPLSRDGSGCVRVGNGLRLVVAVKCGGRRAPVLLRRVVRRAAAPVAARAGPGPLLR